MVRVQITARETGLPSYRELLQRARDGEIPTEALHGDGSDRSFHRVNFGGDTYPKTAILVKGAVPPFVEVTRLFLKAQLPVPQIYAENLETQTVLEEDFGDLLLNKVPSSLLPDLYREAVNCIEKIQQKLTPASAESAPIPLRRNLDAWALYHELMFFKTHFLQSHLQNKINPLQEEALKQEFRGLAESFAHLPSRACHRDFHARNLLLRSNGKLGIVDIQDARMGPLHYDLASLLRDAYISLPAGLEEELLDRFNSRLRPLLPNRSQREIEMIYYRTACQRSLKALGSFAYLSHEKGKSHFLDAMPRAIENVKFCFERNPNLSSLRRTLAVYVPQWE